MRRALIAAAFLAISALAPSLAAQQREGDEAWNQGRHDAARAAYEQVLAADSTAFRANLRIGVILSGSSRAPGSRSRRISRRG